MQYLQCAFDWIGDNAAVLVALSAFFVACYQAWATRRHNRLSVRPHVLISANRLKDGGVGNFDVIIRNSGLGPAIITKYAPLVDSEPLSLLDSDLVTSTIKTMLGRPVSKVAIYRIASGDALSKDQELTLLSIHFACTSQTDYQDAMKVLNRLSAVVDYRSIYGEKFQYDSRKAGP